MEGYIIIKKKNAPDVPMIDRRTRPNWKLVHVPNRVYMNPNSRTRQRIFLPGIAHLVTEGMCEKHGHPYEFQIVIDAPLRDMANILAEFCCRVRAGYQFEPGDVLDDILADGALVRLDLHVDLQFRPVLRVVFQDGQDRCPEDEKCSYGCNLQNVPTPLLLYPDIWRKKNREN